MSRPVRIAATLLALALWAALGVMSRTAVASADTAAVYTYPIPGDRVATPRTEIVFRGIPATAIGRVTVTGSRSGVHTGSIAADSDGRGGSFLTGTPFTPGETVTVRTTLNIVGGQHGAFQFTVAHPAGAIQFAPRPSAPRVSGDVVHYRSLPGLVPAAVHLLRTSSHIAPGDIFVAPQRGPVQWGPMLLGPQGGLEWFDPLPGNLTAADFRQQTYQGKPVLTWWQGQVGAGVGVGTNEIVSSSYQPVASVGAGNGLHADLHEFLLTPQGTALITATFPVLWNATSMGGSAHQDVFDSVVQEIDIKSGLVIYQWDSLDHVPLSDSYTHPRADAPYDYFHVNSVQLDTDGDLVISSRNTSTAYKLNRAGGIVWRLGGKQSTFALSGAARFFFQHDFRIRGSDDRFATVFNDAGGPPRTAQDSSGLKLELNFATHTAQVLTVYRHDPPLQANYEGNLQQLGNHDTFIGWGQAEYFTEFTAGGHELFDAKFVDNNSSYRAFKMPWTGTPITHPAIAITRDSNGISTIYASWNGATQVSSWRILGGPSPTALRPLDIRPRRSFETPLRVGTEARYLEAQAVSSSGATLGTSPVLGGGQTRLSVFGHTLYVAANGVAGVQVGCFSRIECHLTGRITVNHQVIASGGHATLAPGTGSTLFLRLNAAALAALRNAGGHQAGFVAIHDRNGIAAGAAETLQAYTTVGAAPRRSVKETPTLRLLSRTAFASATGVAGLFAGCKSRAACRISTTIRLGGAVVAHTGPEQVGAGDCGIVYFKLSPAGLATLSASHGRTLAAAVSLRSGNRIVTGQIGLIGPIQS